MGKEKECLPPVMKNGAQDGREIHTNATSLNVHVLTDARHFVRRPELGSGSRAA